MPDSARPWEELPALFAMVDEMRSGGASEDEIERFLRDLDQAAFDQATQEMRDAGVPEDQIVAFWREMDHFGDSDELDMVDEESG